MTYEDWLRLQGQQPGFGFGTLGGDQTTPSPVPPITEVPAPQNIPQMPGQPIDWKQVSQAKALQMLNAPDKKESPMAPLGMAMMSLGQQMQVPPALRGRNDNLQNMANALLAWQMRQQQTQEANDLKKVGALSTLQKMSEGQKPIVVGSNLVDPQTGREIYRADKMLNVAPGGTVFNQTTGEQVFTAPEKTPNMQHVPVNIGGVQKMLNYNPQTGTFSDTGVTGTAPGGQLLFPLSGKGPAIEWHPGMPIAEGYGPASQVKIEMGALQGEDINNLMEGLKKGEIYPSQLSKRGTNYNQILSQAQKEGINLAKLANEEQSAKTFARNMNNQRVNQFRMYASTIGQTIDRVRQLADAMDLSGFRPLNYAEIEGKMNLEGNSPAGQLATQYVTQINGLKEEMSQVANAGYAPTESVWKLVNDQINKNYGVKQLHSSLNEVDRLIKYRINALNELGPMHAGTQAQGFISPQPQGQAQAATPQAGFRRELTNKRTGEKRIITDPAEYQRLTGQTP